MDAKGAVALDWHTGVPALLLGLAEAGTANDVLGLFDDAEGYRFQVVLQAANLGVSDPGCRRITESKCKCKGKR